MLGCRDLPPTAPAGEAPSVGMTNAGLADATPPRHLLVLRQERRPSDELVSAIGALGGRIERRHDAIGVVTVGGLSAAAATALAARADVQAIDRDQIVRWLPTPEQFAGLRADGAATQGDQSGAFWLMIGWQWNIRQIEADAAWLISPQGDGALVCILDTGIDPTHAELAGKVDLAKSASFVPAEPTIADYHFHGTAVAALVASNGTALASVAPEARLCAVKVLDQNGLGSFDDVAAGILHAADVGADVINMSLGALLPRRDADTRATALEVQRAVLYAVRRGALVIAGAGNNGMDLDGSGFVVVPAGLPGVFSVGATAPLNQADFDRLASYTNYGRKGVNLMAPGGDSARVAGLAYNPRDGLVSACSRTSVIFPVCNLGTFYLTGAFGTSFAAPQVAGAAAVIESAIPGDQVGARLAACLYRGAAHPDGLPVSPYYGRGRVNVRAALMSPGCGTPEWVSR